MGKGARNRKARAEARENAAAETEVDRALERIPELPDLAALEALLNEVPALLHPTVISRVRKLAAVEGLGTAFHDLAELLEAARENRAAAWSDYAAARDRFGERIAATQREVERIGSLIEDGQYDDAIAVAMAALEDARDGLGLFLAPLQSQIAQALFNRPDGDRASNIDEAIEYWQGSLDAAGDAYNAASALMHLGIAWAQRLRGDPADNLETAVNALRDAVGAVSDADSPELQAMIETNLALSLMRRERGDRVINLREAEQLCRQALTYRNSERNAYDWAHTQLNLGAIIEHRARLGDASLDEAFDAYRQVIEQRDRVKTPWLIGAAHLHVGRLLREEAEVSAEDVVEAHREGEVADVFDNRALLDAAQDELEQAVALTEDDPDRLRHGRALGELAHVLASLDEDEAAIEASRAALDILRPTSAPNEAIGVGWRLGGLLADREQWAGAATAYGDAMLAADILFHTRLEDDARLNEARRAGNLMRWAAYALARSGEPRAAALALETGRMRELRRRLGQDAPRDDRLRDLPIELREAYEAASDALAEAPLGPAGAGPARDFQEVLAAIRTLSGFDDFETGAREQDFIASLEPGWPLIYVNPTPHGTLLLRVSRTDRKVEFESFFCDITSTEILMVLIAGDEAPEVDDARPSYLFEIGGFGKNAASLREGLRAALPRLGERLGRPLLEALQGATGVTLITCGPVGVAPLAAAPWKSGSGDTCLLDSLDVRLAPSAPLAAAAVHRATTRESAKPSLVAVADPTGDLKSARSEVEEVRMHFERGAVAEGEGGTLAFLQANASTGTHIHLACHARGSFFDSSETALELANGPVALDQLVALPFRSARLAVASACQSALAGDPAAPDEVLSIGTAFLAAGSACAVASLWPVDDLATAILMTRLYDELFRTANRPPEALRRAQLWLRDLDEEQERAFLSSHPALQREFARRSAEGNPPGRRGTGEWFADSEGQPYAHPDYWAAFVAVGA